MGEVVNLRPPNPGNGAREALEMYFSVEGDCPNFAHEMVRCDHLLAWLWSEGFKVVPLEPFDA